MRWRDLVKENAKRRLIQGEKLRKLKCRLEPEGLMYMTDCKDKIQRSIILITMKQ
jgi:tRNA G46 methylase TrmB